nr:PREDICTED: uncharacterized protein LOC109033120 [Bemisia tabaci]
MAPLLFGVRLSLNNFVQEKIDDIDLDKTTAEELKSILSKMPAVNLEVTDIELVHCGNILKANSSLSSCGVKAGQMVHVLKKREKDVPVNNENMSEKEAVSIVVEFITLTLNPNSKSEMQKMRSLVLDNITSLTPSLRRDPIALTFLQDPELLAKLGDVQTVKKVIKKHPALVEAAGYIVALTDTRQVYDYFDLNSSTQQLNNLSDDEEMDSSQVSHENFTDFLKWFHEGSLDVIWESKKTFKLNHLGV